MRHRQKLRLAEYQDMVATNQQYEALQTRLNQAYASANLDPAGRITGGSVSVPSGSINFDLDSSEVVFTKPTGAFVKGNYCKLRLVLVLLWARR